jgi:hypothetical protein
VKSAMRRNYTVTSIENQLSRFSAAEYKCTTRQTCSLYLYRTNQINKSTLEQSSK